MDSSYSKHKDRSPEDTVLDIQRILHEAGLFTVMDWSDREFGGVCSNRVTVFPSRYVGQNGKGTDEMFAAASGYAELLERIQNNSIAQRYFDEELTAYRGFVDAPDEVVVSIDDVLNQDDAFMNDLAMRLGYSERHQCRELLEYIAQECYGRTDGTIVAVPFVDLFGERVVKIPFALVTLFGLTNGMCAGNTLEEELVQGLSEILERYVQKRMLDQGSAPPEIPHAELERYGFYALIEQIETDGRYRVSVRDCSLGEGFPVVGIIIVDTLKATFGVRLGCHPSFAVAVERCLTEAFQGKRLETFASYCAVGTPEEVAEYHNGPNVAKVSSGTYPPSFLVGDPDWELEDWKRWESLSNGEYLTKLLSFVRQRGLDVLVRDSSHMGFPSCHIVVPGMNDLYPMSEERLAEFRLQREAVRIVDRLPDVSPREARMLLDYVLIKRGSAESGMGLSLLHYFIDDSMDAERIGAFLALSLGEYALAERFFEGLSMIAEDDGSVRYFRAYAMLARQLEAGLPLDEACKLIGYLFDKRTAERVQFEAGDFDGLLERAFPKARCFDCGSCPLAESSCEYPAVREIFTKIKTALSKSAVSQDMLLKACRRFLPS